MSNLRLANWILIPPELNKLISKNSLQLFLHVVLKTFTYRHSRVFFLELWETILVKVCECLRFNFIVCSVITRGDCLDVPFLSSQLTVALEVVNGSQVDKGEEDCETRYYQDLMMFLTKGVSTLLAVVVDEKLCLVAGADRRDCLVLSKYVSNLRKGIGPISRLRCISWTVK